MSPRMPMCLALLGLAVVLSAPLAAAEPDETFETIPTGIPIEIDGVLQPAEWQDALSLALDHPTGTLRVKQHRGTAMFAFEAAEHWVENSELILYFAPNEVEKDLGAWSDGALTLRYKPLEHDRPHLIVTRQDGTLTTLLRGEVVARAALATSHSTLELAVSVKTLGATGAKDEVLRMAAMWVRPGAHGPTTTLPAGLDVAARQGRPPADLVSKAQWLGVVGFKDPDAPGAYSPTRWQTWVDEQDEIARRGEGAYALYREMAEERRHFLKQDTLVQEQVFDALAYVGAREPLTSNDQLLMAQVLRMLNRYEEALTLLDVLVASRSSGTARSAMYERAQTLSNMGRFDESAEAWLALAQRVGPSIGNMYRNSAANAKEYAPAWAHEQKMRAEDDEKDLPLVELETNRGRVVLQLYPDDVPKAVAHFLELVRAGFYDGLRFHRVIGNFVAQTGDPETRGGDCQGKGKGSSETRIPIEENLRHGPWRGAVAFAVGRVQENGSQFFILTAPQPDLLLDQTYTVFGRVLVGMDVVDRIEYCDVVHSARILREKDK